MKAYKVDYLEVSFLKKSIMKSVGKNFIDGLSTANDMEALFIQRDKEGYELVSITPAESNTEHLESRYLVSGYFITFKPKRTNN